MKLKVAVSISEVQVASSWASSHDAPPDPFHHRPGAAIFCLELTGTPRGDVVNRVTQKAGEHGEGAKAFNHKWLECV